jgi:hypothetical protein
VEVQTRGPVHEAYAEPEQARPVPTLVVPKEPPEMINELPPDEKPEGDNVVWIPGYWGWDVDQSDFIWVSGFWRMPPPNRDWVAGHWQAVDGGWQWTPGFWAVAGQTDVDYLPAPPPSIDQGPSTPAPDNTATYSPGSWVYREKRYYWRPGFWVEYKPGWVWIPAHYIWTTVGYVFVDGYWDHPLEERGLLFAPVRIVPKAVVKTRSYTPQFVVQPDFLISALFVCPEHGHYYFGDYFDARYQERGYVAWVDFRPTRHSYDPNFDYYRNRFRGDRIWETNLRNLYAERASGGVPRPPRTLTQQLTVLQTLADDRIADRAVGKEIEFTARQNVSVVAPITDIKNVRITNLSTLASPAVQTRVAESYVIRTERVSPEQKKVIHQAVPEFRKAAQQRHETEAKILSEGKAPHKVTDPPHPAKIPIAKPLTPAPARPVQPNAPKPPPAKEVPKLPASPKHEDRTIPPHTPPKPSVPPKTVTSPTKPPTPTKPEPAPTKPAPTLTPTRTPVPPPTKPVPPPQKEPSPKPPEKDKDKPKDKQAG